MVSAIFIDFQLFYLLTRITPEFYMFNGDTGQHQFSSSKLLCLYIFCHICMSYDCHVILFMTDYFAHIYFVTFLCHMILFMTDYFAHLYFVTFLCHMIVM